MITLFAHDRATGRVAAIFIPRAEFRTWLRVFGKARLYGIIFATGSRRMQ